MNEERTMRFKKQKRSERKRPSEISCLFIKHFLQKVNRSGDKRCFKAGEVGTQKQGGEQMIQVKIEETKWYNICLKIFFKKSMNLKIDDGGGVEPQ